MSRLKRASLQLGFHAGAADLAQFAQSVSAFEVVKHRTRQAASKWFTRAKANGKGIPR